MKYGLGLFLALCLLVTPSFAQAKIWTVDYKQSKLIFTGTQSGKPFTGNFKNFVARIDFDHTKPEQGKIEVQIDMRSAFTGDTQKDTSLPNVEWFDSKNITNAEFVSTEISETGDHTYLMKGLLKLKMTTKEISVPFTLARVRDGTHVLGEFTLSRKDFDVGTGEWASDEWVGYPVKVNIDLMAY